jgi:branched-chain amino acid transport system permease protein
VLQLIVAGLTVGSGYALIALGIHITLRATRIINFAQGEFTVIGGLLALTFVTAFGVSTWLALVGATIGGFVIGLTFERVVLRPAARSGEMNLTIATIGSVFVLLYGHALVPTWGSLPLPLPAFSGSAAAVVEIGGVAIGVQSLWVIGLLLVALAVLFAFFERTYFGKAIRAAANDPTGARLIGIDVRSTQAVSVGLAIALAAYGGTILGPITLVGGAAGTVLAIKGFVGAIVGGIESPVGCVAGGLAVGVFEKLIQGLPNVSAGAADPIVYSLLLLGLALRPQGLIGTRAAIRD